MIEYLNDEEQLILEAVREFREREIDGKKTDPHELPRDLVKKAGELGFYGLTTPEEYGGADVSCVCYAAVIEELAKTPSVMPTIFNQQNGAARMIAKYSTPAQKEKFLQRTLSGELLQGLSVSEPVGATNYPEWAEIGHTEGDEVVLNGSKIYLTLGRECGSVLLNCKIDGKRQMVFVDIDDPGVVLGERVTHLGGDSQTGMCTIDFNDVHVPKEDIFPGESLASDITNSISYLNMAALALGNARGIYEKTLEYVSNRERYGKPLASFQKVAHKLVDMRTTLDVAEVWIADTARRVDEGKGEMIRFFQAKSWIPEACFNIVNECIVLHGGLGLDEECGLGEYQALAEKTLLMERPADIHRDMVASLMGLPVDFRW